MTNQKLHSAALAFFLIGTAAIAEDHVTTLRWSTLKQAGQLQTGEIIQPSEKNSMAEEELLIVNETAEPLTVNLTTLEPTGISKHSYRIHGKIRYEGVKRPGYLEMWNQFNDGSRYFSRTLSPTGPMRKIHGTSVSREFILPFQSSKETGPPSKLEINLVLPAEGKVWISPLHVSEFTESEWGAAVTASGAWWGYRTVGLIGGILGPLLGIMGAIVGTLSGWGRGKNVCMAICRFGIALGAVCLIGGITALFQSQPFEVYFPLLLIGIIATTVMGCVLPTTKQRFANLELRRMEAMDASAA